MAQRVPDDHVGTVTNGFTVREVDFTDSINFLSSGRSCPACGLRAVAKRHGLWHAGPFDFTKIFAAGGIGEPSEGPQVYVSRRMWSAYRLFGGPPLPTNFSDFVMDAPYPATIPVPKRSVRLGDVMGVMRDYYEGTPFDMTVGMAAGPFGAPDRFGGSSTPNQTVAGGWERTIATHHSIVSLVMESRSWLPDPVGGTLWFAPHAAHTAVYAPFPCGMDDLPASFANASGWGSINSGVAAWANRAVFAAVQPRFKDAIVDVVLARSELDNTSLVLQASTDAAFKAGSSMASVGAVFRAHADVIVSKWWALHDKLIQTANADRGYPAWWLRSEDVGYAKPLQPAAGGGRATKLPEDTQSESARVCVRSRCAQTSDGQVELDCVLRCLE